MSWVHVQKYGFTEFCPVANGAMVGLALLAVVFLTGSKHAYS
jgi:hypothetical protein